jgi:hypothetical protein
MAFGFNVNQNEAQKIAEKKLEQKQASPAQESPYAIPAYDQ